MTDPPGTAQAGPSDRDRAAPHRPGRLETWFNRQPHGGWGRRASFGALAAILGGLEIATGAAAGYSATGVEMVLATSVALAATGWLPATGGTLYTLLMIVATTGLVDGPTVSLTVIGIYGVVADWISRGWYVQALVALAAVEAAQVATTDSLSAEIVGLVLGTAFATAIGIGLRWNQRHVEALRVDAEQSRRDALVAQETIQHELAAALHDTVARDLVQIIVDSQSIARRAPDPGTAEEVDHLGDLGRDAMRHVRSMMGGAPTGGLQIVEPIASVVATCADMLRGREIPLEAQLPDDIDTACPPRVLRILALALREGTTNIDRYGRAGSPARLLIEVLDGGGAALTMTNSIDPTSQDARTVLMGGYGLDNLSRAVANEGGKVHFGSTGGTWMLTVTQPASPGRDLPSGPLLPSPIDEGDSRR